MVVAMVVLDVLKTLLGQSRLHSRRRRARTRGAFGGRTLTVRRVRWSDFGRLDWGAGYSG